MAEYVAFLRGINVSGKQIKMDALRKAFESLGFQNVKTALASGNVLFESGEKDKARLAKTIRKKLADEFGQDKPVMLRTIGEIRGMVDSDPFKGIEVTPQTRLYVTFLEKSSLGGLPIPYESPEGDFKILSASGGALFSVLELSPSRGTVDLMSVIEKEYGSDVTIVKIVDKAGR
jgi:hypothetical protein